MCAPGRRAGCVHKWLFRPRLERHVTVCRNQALLLKDAANDHGSFVGWLARHVWPLVKPVSVDAAAADGPVHEEVFPAPLQHTGVAIKTVLPHSPFGRVLEATLRTLGGEAIMSAAGEVALAGRDVHSHAGVVRIFKVSVARMDAWMVRNDASKEMNVPASSTPHVLLVISYIIRLPRRIWVPIHLQVYGCHCMLRLKRHKLLLLLDRSRPRMAAIVVQVMRVVSLMLQTHACVLVRACVVFLMVLEA